MRCARREGRMERVKLAESSSWLVVRGGRPNLQLVSHGSLFQQDAIYLARSDRVSGCKGLPASLATSPSVTFCFLSPLSGTCRLGVVESRLVALWLEQSNLDKRLPTRFITAIELGCGQSSDKVRAVELF